MVISLSVISPGLASSNPRRQLSQSHSEEAEVNALSLLSLSTLSALDNPRRLQDPPREFCLRIGGLVLPVEFARVNKQSLEAMRASLELWRHIGGIPDPAPAELCLPISAAGLSSEVSRESCTVSGPVDGADVVNTLSDSIVLLARWRH